MTDGPRPALEEYRRASDTGSLQSLAGLLGDPEPVRIVDIGANPIDDEPQYASLLATGLGRVVGFEPQREALARLQQLAGPHETYLPYAVGDGDTHELRICASDGFSSLLEPDPRQLDLLTDFPKLAQVVDREQVATVRLDDIEEIDGVDLLKMDVQGGELAVLEGGRERLRDCVAVQTEVGFHRLYEGAPTFGDVDRVLRELGLRPAAFVSVRTWPLAPTQWADSWEADARQLVEADLLYVRDLTTTADWTARQLNSLALIAHGVYRSVGITLRCLDQLTRAGDMPKDALAAYRALIGPSAG
ncbi:FkbM family methyltransferase [Branchiibius sp. NY16-3462-2]|uniref:FkbM family methyltransferase n=1 Tax=Branchiibius sp. NY16-3462-2 TaxID=1807500 RepID=UPI0025C1380D|nr:FkbM family methyltransferase [Branchiibius sp. NY16-3462-2]